MAFVESVTELVWHFFSAALIRFPGNRTDPKRKKKKMSVFPFVGVVGCGYIERQKRCKESRKTSKNFQKARRWPERASVTFAARDRVIPVPADSVQAGE